MTNQEFYCGGEVVEKEVRDRNLTMPENFKQCSKEVAGLKLSPAINPLGSLKRFLSSVPARLFLAYLIGLSKGYCDQEV